MVQRTDVYPSVRVDTAGKGVVSSAGGVLLTETVRVSGLGREPGLALPPVTTALGSIPSGNVLPGESVARLDLSVAAAGVVSRPRPTPRPRLRPTPRR